jgi:hypothetical protein
VYFVQLDVLEPPKTKSLWDCIVAFGLFSPAVIWSEDAKIALRNLTNITKNGGLIIASTREKFSPKFEQFIDEIDSGFSIQICTDYSSDIAFDKHAFAKGWKQRCKFTGHHYPGYEGHNTMIDAYLAYMKDQDSEKRTNFYITKQC